MNLISANHEQAVGPCRGTAAVHTSIETAHPYRAAPHAERRSEDTLTERRRPVAEKLDVRRAPALPC